MTQREEINVVRYFRIVAQRKWLIALLVVVAMIAAYVSNLSAPRTHQTSAVVRVTNPGALIYPTPAALNPAQLNPGALYLVALNPADLKPESLAVAVTSDKVLKGAISELGLGISLDDLRGITQVGRVEGTDTIRISVTHAEPEKAKTIANAVAGSFVGVRQKIDAEKRNLLTQKLESIEQQIKDIERQSEKIEEALSRVESASIGEEDRASVTASNLQALSSLQTPRFSLNQDYYNVKAQLDETGVTEMVSEAPLPRAPQEEPGTFKVIFAGVLALMAGAVLAIFGDYLAGLKSSH